MNRKPLLVALAAFAMVFLGGAAIAALSTTGPADQVTEPPAQTSTTTEAPLEAAAAPATNTASDTVEHGNEEPPKDKPEGPSLTITSPDDGAHFDVPTVEVTGTTDADALVFLGDKQATQEGENWSLTVELKPGKNALFFKAFDTEGHYTKVGLHLWYDAPDTEGPKFEITSPKNGSHTTYSVIIVRGVVEEGSKVFLGDTEATVDGEKWELKAELALGANTLKFVALDAAGNESTAVLEIFRKEKEEEKPEGPKFSITSPKHKSETDDEWILVTGTVTPGSKVYYGDQKAQVDGDDWKIEVKLKPGWNELWFKAIDGDGNKTKASVKVYLVSDEDHHDFWAKQKYGWCDDEVPYDIFYGKAAPGTEISVTSPYGSGATTANGDGWWELKVYFESAPLGEKFEVLVKASTGESKTFYFTAKEGGGDKDH